MYMIEAYMLLYYMFDDFGNVEQFPMTETKQQQQRKEKQ